MQQTELLHRRNLFIYYTLTVSLIIYALAIYFGPYSYKYHFPPITLGVTLLLGVLFYLKISPKTMCACILVCYNLAIIFLIIQSGYIITFYWFIFILLLANIYRSVKVIIILAIVSSLEIVIILIYFLKMNDFTESSFVNMYLFFILFIIFTGLLQTIYIQRFWGEIEKNSIEKEQHLASTEAYLRLFFEHAQDAIAVVDLEDRVLAVNPAFEKLYGWKQEECIGNRMPLVPPENVEAAKERFERLLQGERFHLFETQDMKKDGTIFDVQISLTPIYDHYNEMIAISFISRDISVKKENERLIMQSEKLKLAGEIASGVAHEIRNPMTVISGFVQMMNADENSPYKMYTELIQSEIDRIDLIISEFLVLSRPQAGKYKPIHLESILTDLQTLYSIECQNREIELVLEFNNSNTWIHGNLNQIKQVFINVIKNALEAIDQKGHLHIELCNDGDDIYIYIKDDGNGIPPHHLERIFEPFYTTKSKGTGLGMMITNKIIQEHQGDIKIRSTEHVGTEVLISFPNIESE